MQINQVYFSSSVRFFEKEFCKRWDVVPYHDRTKPALFKGIYRMIDVRTINAHRGFKVLWHTGHSRPLIKMVNPKNVVVRLCPISMSDRKNNPTEYNDYLFKAFKTKYANFPLRDWSMYKPGRLGDKIYCYVGNDKGKYVMGFAEAEKVQKYTDFEIIYGMLGNTYEWVKENWYDKCFVNFKPSITGGFATATELAYMGRYTISNSLAPFCKSYKSLDDILRIITEESKKIGIVQESVIGDYYDTGEEWKNVKFWLS